MQGQRSAAVYNCAHLLSSVHALVLFTADAYLWAMTIKLTAAQKIQVINTEDVYAVMQQVLLRANKIDRNKEHFWLVCLSHNNHILMVELISLGSVKATIVDPMDVFSFALQKRAVKLIMVHNHPSGEMKPSAVDMDLTERMYAIGKFIQMPVLDHLIISEKEFFGFKQAGLMERIEREKRYDLTFSEQDKLTAQIKRLQKENESLAKAGEKALLQQAKDMASTMLQDGLPIEQVMKFTGLTKRQVSALQKNT